MCNSFGKALVKPSSPAAMYDLKMRQEDLNDTEVSERSCCARRQNYFSNHTEDNDNNPLLLLPLQREEKTAKQPIWSALRTPRFSGGATNKENKHTSNTTTTTVNFGRVAILEFDNKKAPCDTIQRDRWAATRPETNKTYARPNIYNPRGSLVLFSRQLSASSRPIQPKRRESNAAKNERRSSFLRFPTLPSRRSSVAQPEPEKEQQQSMEEGSSVLSFIRLPQFPRRRSSAITTAASAMQLRLPRRRSSCAVEEQQK